MHFPIALKYVDFDTRYPPEWIYDPEAASPQMELAAVPLHATWAAMESLVDEGLVKYIGVCNYNSALIHDLMAYARIKPAMLQVEHPYLTQASLLHPRNTASVTGFSPWVPRPTSSCRWPANPNPCCAKVVSDAGRAIRQSAAQVVLRWGIQRGTAVILNPPGDSTSGKH